MTNEEAIKYLKQLYPNGGHCWLDEQRIEAIGMAIKALQKEPVSIWHNMDEIPIKGEVIVVQTKDTFYGISVQKGGTTYKNRNKDRFVRWAYASDLLNFSNVERTIKNWKEPVSEDLEEAANEYAKDYLFTPKPQRAPNIHFINGANWQKQQMMKNAVSGHVGQTINGMLRALSDETFGDMGFTAGDKVKLIIIKED